MKSEGPKSAITSSRWELYTVVPKVAVSAARRNLPNPVRYDPQDDALPLTREGMPQAVLGQD